MNYVVVAPSFDENSGGIIFLHELVHALNMRGETAALTPMPTIVKQRLVDGLKQKLRPKPYLCAPGLNTPVVKPGAIGAETIVVYPEIVCGNPLNAQNVVRWLLYTPGRKLPYEFGENDMFFRVDAFADLPEVTGGATDLFLWKVNRTYQNEHRSDRQGACFMLRKWGDKPRHPITENAVQIDGLSHQEINDVFNRCEVFYSYDDATMYSHFAAVCGCLSVVLPTDDTARIKVISGQSLNRFGIAYGLGDQQLEHARATQDKVLDLLLEREAAGQSSVDNFIELTKKRFR